ncbi:helicase domain protein [Nitzschia inconspicua]|uniref:Helicase domain protein n=1 Tax=Nitzschia inconspicua TaxID=303405 RepID=A0A9K3LCL9_9STRA|nr:helicase domain protein [Nitzschia inconspicua]
MDSFLSMNTTSMPINGAPTSVRGDIENLLSLLDRAEEVAASGASNFVARNTDYDNLNILSLLEPTPICPEHEISIHKQHSSMKHNHPLMSRPAPKKADQFCASEGSSLSDLFLSMDDEPLDRDEAILAPIFIGSLSKELFLAPEKHPPSGAFTFNEDNSLPDTNDSSSSPIRFRKYQTSQWDDRFQELLLFQQEHGHLLVPHSYPPNQKLAQWVKRQRHQFKRKKLGHHSTLTDEREQQLLEVGFIFDSHRAVWHARFETLKAYRLANGHCGIPAKYEDGSLNVWIKHQRRQYLLFINGERSTMTEERIAALNSIGFNWNPRNFARPSKV